MPHNHYRPELMGSATIEPGGPVEAGSWQSFKLVYTAGKFGIDDSGTLKICFRSATDHSAVQLDDPAAPGFTSIEVSTGSPFKSWYSSRRNIRPWHHTLYIQINRYLSPGDQITVRFGDRRHGSPGLRMQTFCEDTFEFRVYADPFATYDYIPLTDEHQPKIQIVPGDPVNWRALLPTLRRPGDTFRLGIKCEDRWGNPSDKIDAKLRLESSHPIAGLPAEVTFAPGQRRQLIENLRVDTEAEDILVTLHDETGRTVATTNPLRISATAPRRHFWSDMHGQSEETIGTNSARDYFAFARDLSFLDICGHQGNDFQITDAFWRHLNEITAEFNKNGRFLAVPGYEWSGNTCVGGDHNVWYKTEGRPIYRSSRAQVEDTAHPETDCHTINDLFEKLANEDAIVTAHVGGRPADVNFAHNGWIEPSVELHSAWGTFEWIVKDAMAAGYRVGVVSASDGHKGRPGASYPGASKFGSYGGYTCHLMEDLTRDDLFDAFRRRHHYATTGCRMYLDVGITAEHSFEVYDRNPAFGATQTRRAPKLLMGDIARTTSGSVNFSYDITGTAGIERIDLMDGFEIIETRRNFTADDLGHRIRIVCEGAEYRGRGRLVNWTCEATLDGGVIDSVEGFNFWNPDVQPALSGTDCVNWQCVTTGGCVAVDLRVADKTAGVLKCTSNQVSFEVPLSDIGLEDTRYACGGLGKGVRVFRLPDAAPSARMAGSLRYPLRRDGDTRLSLRITQIDCHMGWSSPAYILPGEGEQ